MPIKNWFKDNGFTLGGFIIAFLTLVAAWLTIYSQLVINNEQLSQQAKIASAQYVLNISNQLDSSKYESISTTIENNTHSFPVLKPKGAFTVSDLEDYVGKYETIADLEGDNVINFQMAYDEFSYDFEKIWCNSDVQSDISIDRKASGFLSGPDAYFSRFEYLAKTFLAKDHYQCSNMDNQ